MAPHIKILVVDSNRGNLAFMRVTLKPLGTVKTVSTEEEAIAELPDADIVLVGTSLTSNAQALGRLVTQLGRDKPVVLCAGARDNPTEVAGVSATWVDKEGFQKLREIIGACVPVQSIAASAPTSVPAPQHPLLHFLQTEK